MPHSDETEVAPRPRPLARRDITLVFGKQGMGKTVFTRELVSERRRVIILDPCLEYEAVHFDDLAAMVEYIQEHESFRVRCQWPVELPMLCVIANSAGRCSLVVEEAQSSIPVSSYPLPVSLENIIYRGRHTDTSLVIVAQRAATVHIAARSQWTRLVTFNQSEEADVKWLEGQLGIDRDTFPRLPELTGIMATRDHVTRFKLDMSRGGRATIVPMGSQTRIEDVEPVGGE